MTTRAEIDPHRPPSRTAVLLFLAFFLLGLMLQATVVFASWEKHHTSVEPDRSTPSGVASTP